MEFRSESPGPDGLDPSVRFRWIEHRGPTTVATRPQVDQLNTEGYFVIERAFHPDTMDDVTAALAIETAKRLAAAGIAAAQAAHPARGRCTQQGPGCGGRTGGHRVLLGAVAGASQRST